MSLRDWSWIILLGTIWGCSFLFNAVLIRELGPLWVSAGRVGIGALGCWAFFLATKRSLPAERGFYGSFLVLGIVGYALPFALFPLSQAHLASGVAAIINAMTPMTTVLVSHFWVGGEKASWNKSMGVLAGFAGAAVLASPALSHGGSSQLWAIGACLLATLCYASTLNFSRRFAKVDPTVTATCALTGATLASVPVAFLGEGIPTIAQPETVLALLGIGLISTSFSFLLMYRLLPRVGATNFTSTTFIAPISAIVLGVTVLGEEILPIHLLGMLGVFLGLLLIDGRILRRWHKAHV